MPFGDRTGPMGMGPRTGRGAGYCSGYDRPGYANRWAGGGFGRGMYGRGAFGGHGYRNWYYATGQPGWMRYGAYSSAYPAPPVVPMTPEQEQEALKAQESWLQEQLEAVRNQMNKEKKKEEKKE